MIRILDIAQNDILQLVRDRKIFLFLLVMPVVFTFLFGYAFGGFGGGSTDSRLPVGILDEDRSWLSQKLVDLLGASKVIRLVKSRSLTVMQQNVADEELAGALVIPARYGKSLLDGHPARLTLIADTTAPSGRTIQAEVLASANRLDSAITTAILLEQMIGDRAPFAYTFDQALSSWEEPPIAVVETTSSAIQQESDGTESLAHTSPGMMLQFSIASLLTSAQIVVAERKSRSLQRLLTTATHRSHILAGHYLAMFVMVFGQFLMLILFGWLVLNVNYMNDPAATLLVAFSAAACIAALGLLIGTLAKSEEQAVIFSLVPMFVLSGLGGAWVPLEVTGATFQTIGHLSPVAWAMDGFKNISIRGLGISSVIFPAAVLISYALAFSLVAVWRFRTSEER